MRYLILVIALASCLWACGGTSSTESDYLDAIATQSVDDPRRSLDPDEATCDQIVIAMRASASQWLAIQPPSAIATQHADLGQLLRNAADEMARAGERCRTDAAVLDASQAYKDKFNEWCDHLVESVDATRADCE
jgi:hypothetical protein